MMLSLISKKFQKVEFLLNKFFAINFINFDVLKGVLSTTKNIPD